jgi:hypothetical protein
MSAEHSIQLTEETLQVLVDRLAHCRAELSELEDQS